MAPNPYFTVPVPAEVREHIERCRDVLNEATTFGVNHFGMSSTLLLAIECFRAQDGQVSELIFDDWIVPMSASEVRREEAAMEKARRRAEREGLPFEFRGPFARRTYRNTYPKKYTSTIALREDAYSSANQIACQMTELAAQRELYGPVRLPTAIAAIMRRVGPLEAWGISIQDAKTWMDSRQKRGDAGKRLKGLKMRVDVLQPKGSTNA